jgi:hypothetical protein
MQTIQLSLAITDNLGLKSVQITTNTTSLPNNSNTIRLIALALLKSINDNKDSLIVQDLLNELDIEVSKD